MEIGTCRLCNQRKPLVASHVWPGFVYKRYAADVKQGGKFLDLNKEMLSNAQYKEPWFCEVCDNETLSRWENYGGQFCAGLDKAPTEPRAYDHRLLPFLTSVTWRTAMFLMQRRQVRDQGRLPEAVRHWRRFLRDSTPRVEPATEPLPGRRARVEPFTQHLFVVYPTDYDTHKMLGGELYIKQGLVLSQIGPLFIAGLLGRRQLEEADLRTWEHSRVRAEGGEVQPVQAWRVGSEITWDCIRVLGRHDGRIKKQVRNLYGPGGRMSCADDRR